MAWKNGAGTTSEIATAPANASLDRFDWRVSIAMIDRTSTFSVFPGIDRTLVLLGEAGVSLRIGGRTIRLTREKPAVSFPGEDIVEATPDGGISTDFNVMTRRDRAGHCLERLTVSGEHTVAQRTSATLIFLAEGERLTLRSEIGREITIANRDLVALGSSDAIRWLLRGHGVTVLIVRITYQ